MDACTTLQPLNVVGCHLVLVDILNLHLHSRGFQKKAPDVVYQDVLNKFDSTWGGGQRSYYDLEQHSGHLEG